MLMGEEDKEPEEILLSNYDEGKTGAELAMKKGVKIFLNALSGTADFQTLKLRGYAKKKPITILVDSGSTHNFLDPYTTK